MRKQYLLVSLMLAGCAANPGAPEAQLLPAPTCTGQAECDLKWAAARSFVLAHSGYKFQTYTNDFMETYSPTGGSVDLGARVNREPIGNGQFKFTASFWCDNMFGCQPNARLTLNQFTEAVNAVSTLK